MNRLIDLRLFIVAVSIFVLCPLAFGQEKGQRGVEIMVRLTTDHGQPIEDRVEVSLVGAGEQVLARKFSTDNGTAEFQVNPGGYHFHVHGMNVLDTESPSFIVANGESSHMEMVTVHYKPGAVVSTPSQGTVSTNDLKAPPSAKKEYEKGVNLAAEKKWDKAEEHLKKAIEFWPSYDSAFSALAMVYLDTAKPDQAFTTASAGLQINPENPTLERILGKLLIEQKKFAQAQPLLMKAVAADPGNENALSLLAYTQLQASHCDDALKNAAKAHQMIPHRESFVHIIAGECYEMANQPVNAAHQYQMYLVETPDGANAPEARARVAQLSAKLKQE